MSMRRISIVLAVSFFLALSVSSAYAYETFRGPTGVVIYDQAKAKDVYTLFAPSGEQTSWLIDMKGNIIHSWNLADTVPMTGPPTGPGDTAYFDGPQVQSANALRPGLHDRLLPNGHLLRGYRPDTYDYDPGLGAANVDANNKVSFSPAGGTAGGVLELDWDGNLLWWYPLKDATHIQHHTFYRVMDPDSPYVGHTFILGWELIDPVEAEAAGRDPNTIGAGSSRLAAGIYPDFIREVDANKNTVWEWRTWDHLSTDATMTDPYKFYVNAQTDPVNQSDADWTHGNTVEFNPVTNQVIINFRNWGEFFIINHATTFDADCLTDPTGVDCDPYTLAASDAGDITFRWGNPGNYGAGTLPYFLNDGDQVIFGEHCVVWLGVDYQNYQGTPGNILMFDNGWQRPQGNRSSAVEMTPAGIGGDPADWRTPADGGLSPEVFRFSARNESSFYSAYQGGAERVYQDDATGEMWTFVTSTGEGQLFQVYTAANGQSSVVWDFIVPALSGGDRRCYHDDGTNNSVHRAHQYLPDYAGLAGKNLTPTQGNLSGNCPQMWNLWGDQTSGVDREMDNLRRSLGFSGQSN